ncbi:hypothetical protein BKA56DRAFT_609310 [Ilyonectria sp. MPI-CAGE-AT-0026]|nr:hypothetical protein BKA56DRAFT_609310 [Ilyonectria sp. MPI-CAGE-AT-0026]
MRILCVAPTIGLLSFFFGVAQAVSCHNVTISNAADAAEVRNDCTIITGTLEFSTDFKETVDLSGIEEIQGDLIHTGCTSDCPALPPLFNISSSTLATVGGNLQLGWFHGLQELRFPNLSVVEGEVSIYSAVQLERLDITKLSRVGTIMIRATPNLASIQHEILKSFTGKERPGTVHLTGAVESIDSFFSYPIEPVALENDTRFSWLEIDSKSLPNVRHINFGWSNLDYLNVDGDNLSITLGAANTTMMNMGTINLTGNITKLETGKALTNLTIGILRIDETGLKDLDITATQLSRLELFDNEELSTVTLPSKALDWEKFSLSLSGCPKLNFSSEYRLKDGGGEERFWFWPRQNIEVISIYHITTGTDFFKSFIEQYPNGTNSSGPAQSLESFRIYPSESDTLDFDCQVFDDMRYQGILPNDTFTCWDNEIDSAAALTTTACTAWLVRIVFLVTTVLLL